MKRLFLLFIAALLPLALLAQTESTQKLDKLIQSYESVYGYSGTVKIVVEGKTTFEKSYGLASRNYGIKNEIDTRFSINSISKTFTTVAILILAQEGKIDLQKPIEEYLPQLKAEWKNKITIHHLLSHTSGLSRESGVQPHHEMTFVEQISLFENQKLLFEPGERYGYSNAGVILLGAILEKVSGQEIP